MLAPSAAKERGTLDSLKFVRVSSGCGALQSAPIRPPAAAHTRRATAVRPLLHRTERSVRPPERRPCCARGRAACIKHRGRARHFVSMEFVRASSSCGALQSTPRRPPKAVSGVGCAGGRHSGCKTGPMVGLLTSHTTQ